MKIKAARLLIDWDLYPRNQLDSTNVGRIREAMRAGEELPPIVYDTKTMKVVDGVNRLTAAMKEFGKDAEIEAEGREFANEKELFLEAVRLNTGHGKQLSPFDRARCLILAEEFKVKPGEIAKALRLSPEDLSRLRVTKTAKIGTTVVPLKATAKHLRGRKLNQRQAEGNEKAGGMTPLFYVNQVINLLEGDLVDIGNEKLVAGIAHLQGLLSSFAVLAAEHRRKSA